MSETSKATANQRRCGDCDCQRRNRWGENFMEGFCKCTGWDINYDNSTKKAPDWCPLVSASEVSEI